MRRLLSLLCLFFFASLYSLESDEPSLIIIPTDEIEIKHGAHPIEIKFDHFPIDTPFTVSYSRLFKQAPSIFTEISRIAIDKDHFIVDDRKNRFRVFAQETFFFLKGERV